MMAKYKKGLTLRLSLFTRNSILILTRTNICSFLLVKIADSVVIDFVGRSTNWLQSMPCSKQFFLRNYLNI
ncbi:hypothetical protein ZX61_02335 [Vibrio sp. VPAP30]|uniref:Uncharacterized protein n=1 Tax=Vibrio bivalvicida TaxID=1276888 RepID=A0A177XVS9_9VIBR|nr:hypothetical protein ZX61_02335 [Vibrio sp. VPAP30]OAJ92697.1 hypothetical protein APB76_18615 [Vibrio bivalvicida]